MGSALDKQSSFSGGEVSPECYGRTEIPTYKQSLALCRNFLPTKHGALKNRPGTKFVSACKNPTGAPPRLMSFVFSDAQTYVLEVGDKYIRFHQNGGPVVVTGVPAYDNAHAYKVGDLVSSGGVNYYAVAATTGNAPGNPAFWYALTGNVYEIPTIWAIADVMRLKYAQSGDVITVVHPSYPPQNIERLGATDWIISATLLAPPAYPGPAITSPSFPVQGIGAVLGNGIMSPVQNYGYATNFPSGSVVLFADASKPGAAPCTYFALADVNQSGFGNVTQVPSGTFGPLAGPAYNWAAYTWSANYPYLVNQYVYAQFLVADGSINQTLAGVIYRCTSQNNFASGGSYPNHSVVANDGNWSLAADASHPPGPVTYAITMLLKDDRGTTIESLPTYYTPPGGVFPRFPDRPLGLQLYQPASLPVVPGYTVVGFNIYVGDNGLYGLVDTVTAAANGLIPYYYVDVGGTPDFNQEPPTGTNPFATSTGVSYPGAVAYFQQRIWFARSDAFPNSFWFSAIGSFLDFDRPTFITDRDSGQFLIAATKLEEIRSIVPQRELLLFTSSSETVASGSNGGVGGAITPSSIDVRPASHHGASYLDPQVADHSILAVTAKGCYIRDLQYDWRSASYTGRDITSLVRHLLDGHTIVDWFYAETPDNIIWIVRDDGLALSLTYEQDFQVVAFAQHTSNQAIAGAAPGLFQRVCSVPEGTEDAVYFVVQRNINGTPQNYIERLSSRLIDGPNGPQDYRQVCFLDCAYSFNGRNPAPGPTSIVTLVATGNPGEFTATMNGATPFAATDAALNNEFVVRPDGVPQPGVDDQPGTPLPSLVCRITGFTSASVVTVEAPAARAAGFNLAPYTGTTDWAIARGTFTGLTALEGCAVGALADGEADLGGANNTVLAGSITLTEPGVDVTIGLPYFSDLMQLDTAADAYKTNERTIKRASVEIVNSRNFSVGEDFNHLTDAYPRNADEGYAASPLLNKVETLPIANSYSQNCQLALRVKDPLPVTIVSIIREIEIAGRG